jgi:DNA-binding NarL/FixJ family response regulator
MTVRVLVADDQEMVRTGFTLIIDAQPDMEVVADVGDGEAAVTEARRLRPDVCLLDIRMPRLDGLLATRMLAGPDVADPLKVVVVTTFDQDEYVYGALHAGACGFLLKDAGPALLLEAIRAAANGGALVSPSVTVRLLQQVTDRRRNKPTRQPAQPLSPRELDVVRLVALGRTNAEISAELYLALSTIKTHLGGVHAKLGTRNRVEIAAWAWESGLVNSA